ncbi:hypothetical protein ACH0BF_18000 [Pseudobacillus sp. 179-B 2D1 NHS]|uniref:hypothetical protein n=2 Tax=Pseudobacillus TaxID=108525 RepID=UPI003879C0A3
MKRLGLILLTIMALQTLIGCSLVDKGQGALELVTPTITTADDAIEIKVSGIDENKTTFISVANETIFEDTIENDKVYTLDIGDIKDALRTDYKPKVQLLQTDNDKSSGDITTFKQVRYTVEQE